MREERISKALERLRAALPDALAIYVFGSRASGEAGPASDLDLAVLNEGPLDPVALWDLSSELADAVAARRPALAIGPGTGYTAPSHLKTRAPNDLLPFG